jgi:hypothetical protein
LGLPFLGQKDHKECQSESKAAMDQRKYERIKARLMQKKREAGDALKAIARKQANPAVSREYGKAMDRYQKAKEALERHYETNEMTPEGQKPKRT